MYPSKEARTRNFVTTGAPPAPGRATGIFMVAGIAILLVCCACAGLILGLQLSGGAGNISNPLGSLSTRATPTPDKNAPITLRTPTANDNGIELIVVGFQRPLKVEGGVKLAPNEQFVLVTVKLTNTKKTGSPIAVKSSEFKLSGEGGLTYDANPKTVTIPQQLSESAIAPGKSIEAELIYQIATDDGALKLSWVVGKTTRVIQLEKPK
ncbi:MAG: DUF4352 domain-containing protein [Chloroflexi bacterium]|nr:DUF4352 domain-containing protein [Chloroflexota bacterium]